MEIIFHSKIWNIVFSSILFYYLLIYQLKFCLLTNLNFLIENSFISFFVWQILRFNSIKSRFQFQLLIKAAWCLIHNIIIITNYKLILTLFLPTAPNKRNMLRKSQQLIQTNQQPPSNISQQLTVHENYSKAEFNTKAITLWVSENLFYIEPKYNKSFIPTVLKINRKSQEISEVRIQDFGKDKERQEAIEREKKLDAQQKYEKMEALNFSYFIGIVNLAEYSKPQQKSSENAQKPNKKVLFFAEDIKLVCTISKKNIYKIIKPIYIFYNSKHKQSLNEDEASLLLNISFIFEQGMYYSYGYNLAKPFYKINETQTSAVVDNYKSDFETSKTERTGIDEESVDNGQNVQGRQQYKDVNQYNWAYELQRELRKFHSNWTVPIIQGFVNKIQTYVNAYKFKIALISRRSRKNGGPLQYATGFTNKIGNQDQSQVFKDVANYVETQQILYVKNLYFSFIQIRGTVPLFWNFKYSYGMPSGIQFSKSIEENYKSFKQHILDIKKKHNFEEIYLLNLLEKNSVNIEKKLIQNYEFMVKKAQQQMGLYYTYFDIHQRCSNKNYTQFNKFINDELKQILKFCGFSALQFKYFDRYEVLYRQKGVIRTNCGTCIDRTNIAQSRLAAYQLVYILRQLNIKISKIDFALNFVEDDSPFAQLYRNLWADNGDAISEQYSGTASMESYAIRTGKMSYMATIDHGLTSLLRVIRKLRSEDDAKREAVRFLSSKNEKKIEKIKDYNEQQEKQGKEHKNQEKKEPEATQLLPSNGQLN